MALRYVVSLDNRTPFYFNGNHICLKALKIDIYHETGQPYEIKKLCILKNFLFTIYIYIYSVLRPFHGYFSSYETGQSVGGAKTGEPREKPPDTPASRTWLVSHVARAGLEPTPVTAVRRSSD